MSTSYCGNILAFVGSWQSGIAEVVIGCTKDRQDIVERVIPCENGPTARALIAAFDCAGPGHSIDNQKIRGRKIEYWLDEFGLLKAFVPVVEGGGDT